MRLNETAKGVYVIAATPFADDGALDLESTDRLVDFYLDAGVDGVTILGMMGEAPKLTGEEAKAFARRVLARVNGRVPVVVGVSSPGLAAMKELTASAMDEGAAGVMVAPTPALKTEAQVQGYFATVVEALGAEVPFVLQDYPLTLGVHLSVATINQLARRHPSLVVLKHEDWPGLNKIAAVRRGEAEGARRISILCGNGGLFLPEELDRGADGAMTGFAYPEMMVEVCRLHRGGEAERARDLFDAYLPYARYEQQPGLGLAARKHVLRRRGLIASPRLREPGPKLTEGDLQDIETLLLRQERRLRELN